MSRQTKFTVEGLHVTETDDGLTREDMTIKTAWQRKKVICPRCLYYGTQWEFSKRLKVKRGKHFISTSRLLCPDCSEGFTKKTIENIADMSMEEFAYYFWGAVFEPWGVGDKISWDTFMKRLKAHYSYDNKQIFWDIYWEHKDAGGTKQLSQDEEDFKAYRESLNKEAQSDFEDYKKAFEETTQ